MIRPSAALPLLVVLAAVTACHLPSPDLLDEAYRHVERGRLVEALNYLDRVPASHADYSEARNLARALARRIRASHEKVVEGLVLREQWRDEEAVVRFESALDIWPELLAARGLVSATRGRIAALGEDGARIASELAGGAGQIVEVTTTPIGETSGTALTGASVLGGVPAAPLGESRAARGAGAEPTGLESPVRRLRLRTLLVEASRLLARGERDRALAILRDLRSEYPGDANVRKQLARVLHQRALLAYGEGRLEAAVVDWQTVLRLVPGSRQARSFVRAAQAEIRARTSR